MILAFLALPILLGAGLLIPIIGMKNEKLTPYPAILGSVFAFFLVAATIPQLLAKNILFMQIGGWKAPFGITIVVDALTAFVLLIVAGVAALTTIFSLRYIQKRKTEYYSLLSLLFAGLFGIVLTGDVFNLYVFFEIMAITSYGLTAYYRDLKATEGAIKYLILGSLSASMILLGIAFIYGLTGTLNMAHLAKILTPDLAANLVVPTALGLLLAGFLFKAAIVPLHAWKPDVITAAPAPVGAVFTAATTTACVYVILRLLLTVFPTPLIAYFVLILAGVATMVIGAVLAMQQDNLLRLLAYSVISQTGYVLLAFGIGYFNGLGYTAGIFHLLNMAIFDALLFFVAGIIVLERGTADMTKLGCKSGVLSCAFVVGALASIGIPLLNGFGSKWLIYVVTLETQPLLMAAAAIVSVLTAAYFLKAYSLIFLSSRVEHGKPTRVPISMLAPTLILAVLCIFFGIFPEVGISAAEFATRSFDKSLYVTLLR